MLGCLLAPLASDYSSHALERAHAGARSSQLLRLFTASVFLDPSPSPQAWVNLGVAAMHRAGETRGALSERHGLWSLISLELARRMDPLRLLGAAAVDGNLALLQEKCPQLRELVEQQRHTYWRGSLLLASPASSELGLQLATKGNAAESIPFLWQDLISPSAESGSATVWINLAVALNAARSRAQGDPRRFSELSAISLACFDHAEQLYRSDHTPLAPNGLPPAIAENSGVIDHLRTVAQADPDREIHEARARAVVSKLSWPELKVDVWKLRSTLRKGVANRTGVADRREGRWEGKERHERLRLTSGLVSEAIMLGRATGWESSQLKGSALSLARAAAESAGLMPAVEAAALVGREEASRSGEGEGERDGGRRNGRRGKGRADERTVRADEGGKEDEGRSGEAGGREDGGMEDEMREEDGGPSEKEGAMKNASSAIDTALLSIPDSRLADPLLLLTLGFSCLGVARDLEGQGEWSRAAAIREEAACSFRVALRISPKEITARVGLEKAIKEAAEMETRRPYPVDEGGAESGGEIGGEASDEGGDEWEGDVGGTPALVQQLRSFLRQQRASARWLAAEEGTEGDEPPRILLAHVPN
ncbi:MAG: hypothetical protein SGPRY_008312, partial [Prymnesium sp.]